jgi:uncharacterized membrane protein
MLRNFPRKVALVAVLVAILAVIIGAAFASMRASDAPTALENLVVRVTVLCCLVIGVVAYVIGGRMPQD